MNEQKLFKGVMIGAIVGGLVTLFDKGTREYTWSKVKTTGNRANYYIKHPSEAVSETRACYNRVANDVSTRAQSTLQMLSQLQDTLENISEITAEESSPDKPISLDRTTEKV